MLQTYDPMKVNITYNNRSSVCSVTVCLPSPATRITSR